MKLQCGMSKKSDCYDNAAMEGLVFVERLWKSVKYEEVYLRAYDSVSDAKAYLGKYFNFYNTQRPHQSLDGDTPDEIYYNNLPQEKLAA